GAQQGSLEADIAAVAAKQAARRDDPVAGDVPGAAALHDVADRPGRTRLARRGRDVAVRRDLAGGDATDDGKHASGERHRHAAASEEKPDSRSDLEAAGIHRHGAAVAGVFVDRRARETHEAAGADLAA